MHMAHRPPSGRHLDRHSAEHDRREAGTRTDVVSSERILTIDQQLTAVVVVIIRQLYDRITSTISRVHCALLSAMSNQYDVID